MSDAGMIGLIWERLETLQGMMTSMEAEDLTPEQLEFVASRLSVILEEADSWFVD